MKLTLLQIVLLQTLLLPCAFAEMPIETLDARLAARRAEVKAKIAPYFNAALSKSNSLRLAGYALQLRDYDVFYELLDKASSADVAALLLPHYAFCLAEDGDIDRANKLIAEIHDYDGVWFGNRLETIDFEEFRRKWKLQANRGHARWLATHGKIDDAIGLEKRCIQDAKKLVEPIELSLLGLSRYCAKVNLVDECVHVGEEISNHPQVFIALTESRLPYDELVQFIAEHQSTSPNLVAAGLSIAERYPNSQAKKLLRLEYELEKPKASVYWLVTFYERVVQAGDNEFAAQVANDIMSADVPLEHFKTYAEFLVRIGLHEKAKTYLASIADEFEKNIAGRTGRYKDYFLRVYAQQRIGVGLLVETDRLIERIGDKRLRDAIQTQYLIATQKLDVVSLAANFPQDDRFLDRASAIAGVAKLDSAVGLQLLREPSDNPRLRSRLIANVLCTLLGEGHVEVAFAIANGIANDPEIAFLSEGVIDARAIDGVDVLRATKQIHSLWKTDFTASLVAYELTKRKNYKEALAVIRNTCVRHQALVDSLVKNGHHDELCSGFKNDAKGRYQLNSQLKTVLRNIDGMRPDHDLEVVEKLRRVEDQFKALLFIIDDIAAPYRLGKADLRDGFKP